jgi:chromosome segregation ATPase
VPLAERRLLDGPQRTLRCSPRELLERMSRSFDDVKTALAQIGAKWDKLLPALDATRRLAAESRRLAEDLGESGRADLESAVQELDRLSAAVSSDPLSVRPAEIERLAGSVKAIRDELEQIAALKRDFDGQLSRARGLLESLQRVLGKGQAAYEEAIIKIAAPSASVRQPSTLSADFGAALTACEALAGRGAWREARRELERFTTRAGALLDDAQAVLAANRAPIEARNQYRALLEAYQVKASALGVVENPRVAAIFDQARQVLYTAPTDLAVAGELVRRYQGALTGPREPAL